MDKIISHKVLCDVSCILPSGHTGSFIVNQRKNIMIILIYYELIHEFNNVVFNEMYSQSKYMERT